MPFTLADSSLSDSKSIKGSKKSKYILFFVIVKSRCNFGSTWATQQRVKYSLQTKINLKLVDNGFLTTMHGDTVAQVI